MLRKDIGWFDHKENSPGQLTSVLATEVQTLNGVSVEAIGVGMEAAMGMLTGMVIAFIFAWKVALVSLAVAPLLMIGSMIQTKMQKGNWKGNKEMEVDSNHKDANVLVSDSCLHYLTVASFGF